MTRSLEDVVPARERTLAPEVLAWTAAYLRRPDGPEAGAPFRFTREQARILGRWFAIDDRGRFVYRRGVIRRLKGWGKSPVGAALAAIELCGPSRFGGFDARGVPVAVPVPSPWVVLAAVAQEQTKNITRALTAIFSDRAVDEYGLEIGKTIVYGRGGQIEAITSNARAAEGARCTLALLDESQNWMAANGGHEMAEAIRRNLAKSPDGSARSLELCNAHAPGQGSVAERTYEAAWAAHERGETVPGLYYDALVAPDVPDLTDAEAVREGLLVARGDSTWLDVDRLAEEIADPGTPPAMARRFYLNQPVAAAEDDRWMDMKLWDSRADPGHEIGRDARVVLGFDGGQSDDHSALVAVEMLPDGRYFLDLVEVWRPPEDDPDWIVPVGEVEDRVRWACRASGWRVAEIAADPARWLHSFELLRRERLPIQSFAQGHGRMAQAAGAVMEGLRNGTLTHSGDPDLRAYFANATAKETPDGVTIAKDRRRSKRKIDAAAASLMAFARAQAQGPPKSYIVDVYEMLDTDEKAEVDRILAEAGVL